MVVKWIIDKNLKPCCEILAAYVSYDFDDGDWQAILIGVEKTNIEQNVWFDYPLIGNETVRFRIANDVGTTVVFVDIQTSEKLESQMNVAIDIMQTYHLIERVNSQ